MPDFNDSLDAIFAGDTGPGREIERPAAREYIAKTTAPGYVQTCPRCRGTGRTPWGVCFKCKGARSQTFKTSPEARAKARDIVQARTTPSATARVEAEAQCTPTRPHAAAYHALAHRGQVSSLDQGP